ncbi:MAG: cation:proton antiporter [Actinomycetota bacterium]
MFGNLLNPAPHTEVEGALLVAYVLLDVFLIVALARILGSLMTRIGQPRVVGEILAGLLLGPTLLGADLSAWIAPLEARPTLTAIATIALVLFMFLAGVEYDLSGISGKAGQATMLAGLSVAVPAVAGFGVAAIAWNSTYAGPGASSFLSFALFMGAALSVTAFPVMAHILMERGELNSRLGSLGVAVAGIMSVLMFTYIGFASAVASSSGFSSLAVKIGLIVVFGVGSAVIVRPLLARMLAGNEPLTGNQMAVIFAGLVLYGLIADRIGVNALVGGFVWGIILPADRALREEVASKLRDIAMVLFLPVFFAISGFATDLKLMTLGTLPVLFAFLVAAIASKFIGAAPARRFGLSWRETGYLGALVNSRGLLVLVVGLIGLQLEIITVSMFTIFVVMALVTNLMTLPLLNAFSPHRPARKETLVRASASS